MVVHKIFNLWVFDLKTLKASVPFSGGNNTSQHLLKIFTVYRHVKIEEQIQLDTIFCDTNTGVVQAD